MDLEDLPAIAPDARDAGFCTACLSGEYPMLG